MAIRGVPVPRNVCASAVAPDVRAVSNRQKISPDRHSLITRVRQRSPSTDKSSDATYTVRDRNHREEEIRRRHSTPDRTSGRRHSPPFPREESLPPIISEAQWHSLKASEKRRSRTDRTIHDSSSGRSRIFPQAETDRLNSSSSLSPRKSPLQFITVPKNKYRPCEPWNSSPEKKVFNSHHGRHLADELGRRNAIS